MNIDLEKLLELAKASTPGPWAVSAETPQFGDWSVRQDPADWNGSGYRLICSLPSAKKGGHYGEMFRANAHFIAAANPATVTELVSMVNDSTLACIADVQAEPEFPGDAPPELIAHIRQCIDAKDVQNLLHMMRMAVSITKKGIQERIAARTGIAIEGIFGQVVRDQCSCGEPISVELNCPRRTIRTDKKRPFYPDEGLPDELDPQNYSEHGTSVFRCRKCGEPVDETVPAAKYERVG
ncbi:ead/Ea22-like family protein [Aeromonas salmonicida]|uniref:hypothetical protein n=1 Tax=Aeromonas salmonicida TaxID=645 RepID=UPI00259ECD04|nr:hypothetical protein [Aeromonas salmonicida]MDM5134013.1 ead/Ea22-like family protein [Aeromonas salmonicida]